jgi:O-antigen/teichoic acid export membrane protein
MLIANIFAGYISQLYVMILSILCIPIYIQYLGVASYGLVGFFAAIQGWFSLVDMGLIPAIARESSKYQAGAISALDFRRIYRILIAIFVLIALLLGAVLWLQANNIVENWLKIDGMEVWQVKYSVQAMSICIALRWFGGLYKGVLTGAEKLVSLGIFNIGIGTIRYFGAIPAMFIYGATPTVFFTYQLIIAGLEVVGLFLINQKFVPAINEGEIIGWSLKPISNIFKFSATISFATFIWIANTQSDRLVLSGVLSLVNYGYFTTAVLIASGINLLTAPISTSLMPSLTRLHAQKNINEYLSLYRAATQWVVIVAGSAAAVLVFLSHQLIYAWSGSNTLAENTSEIVMLYGIGNWVLSISAFGYYLQYSKGELKYHLLGNVLMISFYMPALIYFASEYGGIGAGYVWVISNLIYLVIWIAFIHKKYLPGIHYQWLLKDILQPALIMMLFSWVISRLIKQSESRIFNLIETIVYGSTVLIIGVLSTKEPRRFVTNKLQNLLLFKS